MMRFLAGRRPFHGEEGQTAIIMAIVLVVLLGFGALATDVGRAYEERQQLQRTADAVAISGAQGFAQLLPTAAARQSAAFDLAKRYEAANTKPAVDGPAYHPSGYTGDLLNPNPGNCYSVLPPNPLASTDCIAAQPAGCPVLAGGSVQNFDCVQARIVDPQFPWMFAGVLGFQPRALSARSVAIVGTGAPGGATLMPWLLLDCPDSDGSRGYSDEGGGVQAAANTVHPLQTCPYQYVYGPAGSEFATYNALAGGGGPPGGSSGALFNLFAGDKSGGNFGAAQMAPSPCVSKFDGYFNKTSGTKDYRDAVAGNPNTCFAGPGARLWTKTGELGANTNKALDDRGVATCMNATSFQNAIAFRGDSVVDIKQLNPCIMAMMLVVHLKSPAPAASQTGPPNDVHGTHANIVSWQDSATPAPAGCNPGTCDGNWRFGPLGGGVEDVLVRRIAFFYMTSMDKSKGNYQGLLLRVFDSSSPLVGPGNPGDGDLVVKLTCLNNAC